MHMGRGRVQRVAPGKMRQSRGGEKCSARPAVLVGLARSDLRVRQHVDKRLGQSQWDMCADMCLDVCAEIYMDVCIDMCVDICIGMCVDICIDMCADICIDMCADICVDMCADMCTDVCADICIDMCAAMHVVTVGHDP